MFQLIVAVISIALVAALAIASIYYGGSAFSSSSLRANVVTLVNGGQQIAGAAALYKTDFGVPAASMEHLSYTQTNGTTYLSAAPGISTIASGSWSVTTDSTTGVQHAVVGLVSANSATVCAEVAKQAGTGAKQFYCADSAAPQTELSGPAFTGANAFVFKL